MSLTFGEKIKEARKQKNLTQKQLADLIGAAHNSISDWENNKNKPDPDTIELLCGALKITPNYLLASTEDDFSPKEKLLIKKYRLISTRSPDGAVVVDTVLDREYAIAEKLREQNEKIIELADVPKYAKEETPDYLKPVAAHNEKENEEQITLMQKDIAKLKIPK